jgi:PKD repeat protein
MKKTTFKSKNFFIPRILSANCILFIVIFFLFISANAADIVVDITSPVDSESLTGTKVMVKGTITINNASINDKDIGVIVNGFTANIYNSEWVANNVTLKPGTNIIEATAIVPSGQKYKNTITVTADGILKPIRISASKTSGIAPLTTYFSVDPFIKYSITSYEMDFDGDRNIDYTGTSLNDKSFTFSIEGIYYPTVTATDSQDNAYTETIGIVVMSKVEMDKLLKSKWAALKTALETKNLQGALHNISVDSQSLYRYNISLLEDNLPMMSQNFLTDIVLEDIYEGIAKYQMSTPDGSSFYIEFIQDYDGIWRINFF